MAASVCGKTTDPKLERSKPTNSCDWPMLANDRTANVADMNRCLIFKMPSPLFQVKHKTDLNRESIAMFNAALAVGLHFGSIELKWVSNE